MEQGGSSNSHCLVEKDLNSDLNRSMKKKEANKQNMLHSSISIYNVCGL